MVYHAEEVAAFSAGGQTKLAELRAEGHDPVHGAAAARKREVSRSKLEQAVWDAEHGTEVDPYPFQRAIVPYLQEIPSRVMAEAIGLSEQYCSFMPRDIEIPPPTKHVALRNSGSWWSGHLQTRQCSRRCLSDVRCQS